MTAKPELTLALLQEEASEFCVVEDGHGDASLYGVTDGKAVGTYLEKKFVEHLQGRYAFEQGNSARGIDLPSVEVDIKVTSIRQPQSSCPFRSARQKIFGLGYNLIVFVYDKFDDDATRLGHLKIEHAIFVEKKCTADFQMTKGLLQILENDGNEDDIVAFLQDRNLPIDEIEARNLAGQILETPPVLGYLTISNALQWRLQYGRVIHEAGDVAGLARLR